MLPKLRGVGGPSSFQAKLKLRLKQVGIQTHHNIYEPGTKSLLVIGGTRQIGALIYAKRNRVRIVQRLDGMNWLHKKHATGFRHNLRSERNNLQLSLIRRYFADAIVYQSNFTREWWNTVYGVQNKPSTVIHNGVDLNTFSPGDIPSINTKSIRMLVIEGSFRGGHVRDLKNAVGIANGIAEKSHQSVDLLIAGIVPEKFKAMINVHENATVHWLGLVQHEKIPVLNRSAHLFYPAEINAACPNALIEAMACGVPIIGYATGSLPELVGQDGGAIVPYNGDFWNLEPPDSEPLVDAAINILGSQAQFRQSARQRAEKLFSVESMVEKYRRILLDDL